MSHFIDKLENIITAEVKDRMIAQPGSIVRMLFCGPSTEVLEKLLESLMAKGGICVSNNLSIPALLVTKDEEFGPSTYASGKCSDEYLVNCRNVNRSFVALVPIGVNICLSMESSVSSFGIDKQTCQGITPWSDDFFITKLIEDIRPASTSDTEWDNMRNVIRTTIHEYENLASQDTEKRYLWHLLQDLYDNRSEANQDILKLMAVCGVPYAERSEIGSDDHLGILSRLAEYLETVGLGEGFANLTAKAPDELKKYLSGFRKKVMNSCQSAPAFSIAPRYYYSSGGQNTKQIPDWWKELSLEVWCDLLDETKPTKKSGIVVKCNNSCYPVTKGMPVIVNDTPVFEITASEKSSLPNSINAFKGQDRNLELLGEISPELNPVWEAPGLPTHKSPLRYKFDAGDSYKPAIIKVISLEQYQPGFVVGCHAAKKITPLKKRRSRGRNDVVWESDIHLRGMGTFQVELYHSSGISFSENAVAEENNSEHEEVKAAINSAGESRHMFLAETDEESTYSFIAYNTKIGDINIKIHIHAEPAEPTGADSEFDRLIKVHTTGQTGKGIRVEIPWAKRIYDLEKWLLQDENSCFPLVISGDYMESWKKPNWKNQPILSNFNYESDIRPDYNSWNPPEKFISIRKGIQDYIASHLEEPERVLELFSFSEAWRDPIFRDLVQKYLNQYLDWVKCDYSMAILSDIYFVVPVEKGHDVLSLEPEAVLLNPLHPIRFAWHCLSQSTLADAINTRKHCPAASILNPCMAPDILSIPCLKPNGQTVYTPFLSIQNNSSYWGVLWNGNKLNELAEVPKSGLWGDDWGIKIDGLSSGFTASQVKRAISDEREIVSAKNTLSITLASDTAGKSSCNDGIFNWCSEHLGDIDRDPWFESGPRCLDVIDMRDKTSLQPSPAVLSNLTSDTNATIRWFTTSNPSCSDLSIIAQLGHLNPDVGHDEIYSPLSWGGLLRTRIRRQMTSNTAGSYFISESRVACGDIQSKEDDLASTLCDALHHVEKSPIPEGQKDCYSFAPSINSIVNRISHSKYCALSSSSIDPSCFFGKYGDSYLWDYDLPSYSQSSSENVGFYLLAKETQMMIDAVKKVLEEFAPVGKEFEDETIKDVLYEVARRGMPTLKRLASGGTSALGELGMLVTLRLLQDDFIKEGPKGSLSPAYKVLENGDTVLTMLIPVDPFQAQIGEIRRSSPVSFENNQRPDIIVFGVTLSKDGDVKGLKITPVEVKARTSIMTFNEKEKAIGQASYFSEFIDNQLVNANPDEPGERLWDIVGKDLLASWITFAFRIYGQLEVFPNSKDWAKIHEKVLSALYRGKLSIQVDPRGRLIVVDASHQSSPKDIDKDGFFETIVIKPGDAHQILCNDSAELIKSIGNVVGSWNFEFDTSKDEVNTEPQPASSHASDQPKNQVLIHNANNINNQKAGILLGQENTKNKTKDTSRNTNAKSLADKEGVKFSVGETIGGFTSSAKYYWPSNTELNQLNIGIVGDLGTGKTQLTKALIYNLVSRAKENRGKSPKFLILDYKKDYSKDDFVNATGAKVFKPHKLPINIFDTSGCSNQNTPWIERYKFFADLLSKIYSGIGPVQELNLRNAVKKSYEMAKQKECGSPLICDILDQYLDVTEGKADSPTKILYDMVDLELFETDRNKIEPFSDFFDGVVVIDLSALGQDDRSKNMLVAIFLNCFYEFMLRIDKQDYIGSKPSLRFIDTMLLVDEADNIMQYDFDVLRKILLQGREFGVGVLLASQYLSHFKTTSKNYQEMLLTWFIHKVPNITVRELEAIGLNNVDNETLMRIRSLGCHECLYKTFDVDGQFIKGTPFYKL